MEKFKVELIDLTDLDRYGYQEVEDTKFDCIGTIGDKLLLVDSKGRFIEVYPRRCKRI